MNDSEIASPTSSHQLLVRTQLEEILKENIQKSSSVDSKESMIATDEVIKPNMDWKIITGTILVLIGILTIVKWLAKRLSKPTFKVNSQIVKGMIKFD